jgi:hypothetical protein
MNQTKIAQAYCHFLITGALSFQLLNTGLHRSSTTILKKLTGFYSNIIYKKQKCSQSLLGFMKELSPLLVLSVTTHAEYNAHSFHSFCTNADISMHSIFIHPSQCTNPAHIIADRNTARNKTFTPESYPTELTAQFTCILHDQRTTIGYNKVWSSNSV